MNTPQLRTIVDFTNSCLKQRKMRTVFTKNQSISVIVPLYNEADNIKSLHKELVKTLNKTGKQFEIIYVDDYSTDGTFSILKKLQKLKFVRVYRKIGRKGKAYSLIEGFQKATGNILVMIDGDLQYPPNAILPMVKMLKESDVVVANREKNKESFVRRTVSRAFRYLFGKMMFGLTNDIQAGLKVFTKEVYETIKFKPTSAWTFDLEFLHRARQAGFTLANYDIVFAPRAYGDSKVSVTRSSLEIGTNAMRLKMKKMPPMIVPPKQYSSMQGAGIGYKKKKYITHTTLPLHLSALQTMNFWQQLGLLTIILTVIAGFIADTLDTLRIVVSVLSIIYFIDTVFNLFVVLRSLRKPAEIIFEDKEIAEIAEIALPIYSILCPLYKEAHVVPQFIEAISRLDWPKNKLDVILLLEEDDIETIDTIKKMKLPFYFRKVIVPNSAPKTKPKACNYGLAIAKGDYLVIYDAEDMPDPLQLKKAYIAFQKAPGDVKCMQAKLNYYNPTQNLLTRFFTAEYSLWFDLTLTGLQSLNSALPLGGTSNHFKTKNLRELQGWDPFNVTEDADLGTRLFQQGYKTAVIDSTTLEEANSKVPNWLRQRSRWIKGYMQTYLVNMRNSWTFIRKKGLHHELIFQMTVGGKLAFLLINPFLWLVTILYFGFYPIFGPTIESLYLVPYFYLAIFAFVFGNFLFLYYYMIGCAKRNQWSLVKYSLLIPFYWLLMSIAALVAIQQLLFKPHYWEKTVHGLHLKTKPEIKRTQQSKLKEQQKPFMPPRPVPSVIPDFSGIYQKLNFKNAVKNGLFSAGILVVASFGANVLNLAFNLYVGKEVDLADFGFISLISSLLFISNIPFAALNSTVNYKSAFLDGQYGEISAFYFWKHIRKNSFYFALIISALWLCASPFLVKYFKSDSIIPFVIFVFVWIIGFAFSVDKGYLYGKFMFGTLALLTIFEPFIKFISAFVFVKLNLPELVYISIPLSFVLAFVLSFLLVGRKQVPILKKEYEQEVKKFPNNYFLASILSGLSTLAFMSLDIMLAKHYLSAEDAGKYALISLVGKMVFFLGGLSTQFVIPLVSRNEGGKKDSTKTLYILLAATFSLSFIGFLVFGVFGYQTLPIIFGGKAAIIISYITLFSFSIMCFTISRVYVSYYLSLKSYTSTISSFLLIGLQFVLIQINHTNIQAIVNAMVWTGILNLAIMLLLHLNYRFVKVVEVNLADLLSFKGSQPGKPKHDKRLGVLILNWRDIKHTWAGGAEVYIHELAKRWVKEGNSVTVFCGNDGENPRNQIIDGVKIIRRGGTYTVYIWAFIYYLLFFKQKTDVVIDCENGIPFFSPLYVKKPVFLVVHHVHQEVFRRYLSFPLAQVAEFLEAKCMPFLYKNKSIITVSESSRKEIYKLGFSSSQQIQIIYNGINSQRFTPGQKTPYPSFAYLGRLKPYKNIDIAINAFSLLLKTVPAARLTIAGEGDSLKSLTRLVKKLGIQKQVNFLGKVNEKKKASLLSESWAVLQPSEVEGWGITVIEANASGTPVIASKVNGLSDSVLDGKTGILVKPHSIKDFTSAMQFLINDSFYLQTLSRNAFVWSKNFDWDESATLFATIIENTVRGQAQQELLKNLIFMEAEKA